MNPIGYVAIEYSSGGSPMEVVDGVIRESAEDIREVAYGLNRIPGDERYEAAVIVHTDDLERLVAERDADRAEIVQLCQERLDLTAERDRLKGLLSGSQAELRDAITAQGKAEAERDEARAEAERHLGHLRTAHPAHFTPNVLGERMCGCGGQWPCPAERDELEQARAALDRVRSDALADAIEAVCGLQIRDASRLAEHHGHGDWCKGGTAPGMCHVAEAHATANRVLDALRALDGSGT